MCIADKAWWRLNAETFRIIIICWGCRFSYGTLGPTDHCLTSCIFLTFGFRFIMVSMSSALGYILTWTRLVGHDMSGGLIYDHKMNNHTWHVAVTHCIGVCSCMCGEDRIIKIVIVGGGDLCSSRNKLHLRSFDQNVDTNNAHAYKHRHTHTHKHTHTHTHTHMHTYTTHTHIHVYTHTQTHPRACARTHTYTHTHTRTHAHTHIHIHTPMNTHTRTHTHWRMLA